MPTKKPVSRHSKNLLIIEISGHSSLYPSGRSEGQLLPEEWEVKTWQWPSTSSTLIQALGKYPTEICSKHISVCPWTEIYRIILKWNKTSVSSKRYFSLTWNSNIPTFLLQIIPKIDFLWIFFCFALYQNKKTDKQANKDKTPKQT